MRKLTSLMGNSQWLDGGAMFGNAPKALWTRWIKVDEQNRIPLCCRALLIEDGDRKILLETGIGAFFEPKFKERYGVVESNHVLLDSLKSIGYTHEDIDFVILSHLHFDHAGGILSPWVEGEPHQLLFPNAKFIVSEQAWERANHPHFRDRASFIPELNQLLKDSNRLILVKGETTPELGAGFKFHYSDGHTPGLLMTEIDMPDGPIVFVSDLIPGAPWVHVAISMGYDRFPELVINEKEALLKDLIQRQGRLFFTHDHEVALAKVAQDEKGRFFAAEPINDLALVEL